MTTAARIAMTGAGGFLGFHTRALFRSMGQDVQAVPVGDSFDGAGTLRAVDGADRLIHLAGTNRGTDEDIRRENILFADQLAETLSNCTHPPKVIIFANSIQAGNGSVYGSAKEEAGAILAGAAEKCGSEFINLALPNLFGEHGRPFYNSVTATFCHLLARGGHPEVQQDRSLALLHVQHAAEIVAGYGSPESMDSCVVELYVSDLLARLTAAAETYRDGTIPRLGTAFDRDLFNTYRSYLRPDDRAFKLSRHADDRGSFFEVVKSQGSSGQTSFSTTVPGVVRGEHFHLRKIERFCVLSGSAKISMRRLFSDDVVTFDVNGHEPVAVDMPTMWAHNIHNTGKGTLYTAFWSNEIFNPETPDTFPEDV